MQGGRGIAVAALLASLVCAPQAWPQDAVTLRKSMIGQWELSTTERSKTCVVTLKNDSTPQGLKLELEPGCPAALPFTKSRLVTMSSLRSVNLQKLIFAGRGKYRSLLRPSSPGGRQSTSPC